MRPNKAFGHNLQQFEILLVKTTALFHVHGLGYCRKIESLG